MISKVKGNTPKLHETVFVHKSAVVTGEVELQENVSVWPCAVLRGDMSKIVVGAGSNIQDNAVLHTNANLPIKIGKNVVVAHNVNLHSCEVGDDSLVGIGAIVLDGAKVGKNSLVAAGALVPPGKQYPDGVMLMGSPAKVVREMRQEELDDHAGLVRYYVQEAQEYLRTEEEL